MSFFKKTSLEDTLFELRFTEKQLERYAKKAEKEQKQQQAKVKKAIEQKNIEGARIYAENAIRKKNEGLNYLRMAGRVDAVVNRVQTALTMKDVAKKIEGITKGLDKAMASMDLEKVSGIMGKFESQFEDLDVASASMDNAMGAAMTLSTPADQVDDLIRQVAAENDIEVESKLAELSPGASTISASASSEPADKEDQLTRSYQFTARKLRTDLSQNATTCVRRRQHPLSAHGTTINRHTYIGSIEELKSIGL